MAQLSFTNVNEEGFIAFSQSLTADDWGAIDITSYEGPNRTALVPLCDAPTVVLYKLKLRWAIGEFLDARAGADSAKDLDRNWDDAQKRLRRLLDAAATDRDGAKREAAARLKNSLLMGAGEGQTKLKYQQEVDFGRQQLQLTSSGQNAADIALLGLATTMSDIEDATDALAAGIGHGQTNRRPSKRRREAMAACASVFLTVAKDLAWLAEHGQDGADRARAGRLWSTLEVLSLRYPAAGAAEEPADEDPAPTPDE